MALSAISLFSGAGMLDEGLRAGLDYLGVSHRTVCHVEREAHAAAVLVARMEEGSMDAAPVWSDVTTFDARRWRGRVDCIVAGFPCQDISVAGKRAGLDGHRSGLFYEVTRIAADCDAWMLFLENVGGIASATATVMDEAEGELFERAAARVVGELADLGWDAEWMHLSASDVGASHGRERWFCLAWRQLADTARHVGDGSGDREAGSRRGVCETGNGLGDPSGDRRNEGWPELPGRSRRSDSGGTGVPLADASGARSQGNEQQSAHEQDGRTDGRTDGRSRNHADQLPNFVMFHFSHQDQTMTNGQTSSENTQNSRRHLNPLFAAWLMGWPSTWAIAEPHASSASETASFRCKLRLHLSSLLGEQDSLKEGRLMPLPSELPKLICAAAGVLCEVNEAETWQPFMCRQDQLREIVRMAYQAGRDDIAAESATEFTREAA